MTYLPLQGSTTAKAELVEEVEKRKKERLQELRAKFRSPRPTFSQLSLLMVIERARVLWSGVPHFARPHLLNAGVPFHHGANAPRGDFCTSEALKNIMAGKMDYTSL